MKSEIRNSSGNNITNNRSCNSPGDATAGCRSNRFASGRAHFNSKKKRSTITASLIKFGF